MMPTPEEQALRNQQLARAVASGTLSKGQQVHKGPELPPGETEQRLEGWQPELTDEQVAQRMTPTPEEEEAQPLNIIQRMAENYQTSPQYRQLLDQELQQISNQIAQLTQRRNMIEMARRGQG
jgi:hypothetical protein